LSQTTAIAAARPALPEVRSAIARAAEATGVDFDYLLAQARIESSLDPSARAATSSAAGLYQFTGSTWLETLERHGANHGLGWAASSVSGGRVSDPALRAEIMALRHDPQASALMAAEFANDNRTALSGVLGREPDATELYLAHFLGAGGASKFLGALQADSGQSATALLPQPAAANRAIFHGPGGARSVGEVMALIRGKVGRAMESGGLPVVAAAEPALPPLAREFHAAAPPGTPRLSMAETLRSTFGLTGASAPAGIRASYDRFARFGL
jgi:hypothetical protein